MKNTTGYSLNAFLDFDRPVEIFRNLLVGSEGTLAFIAEAVLNTVPDLPGEVHGPAALPDIHAACAAIVPLRDAGAKALELMDRASLRSVEDQPGIPPSIRTCRRTPPASWWSSRRRTRSERPTLEKAAREAVGGLQLLEPARFTHDRGGAGAPVEDPPGDVPVGRRGAEARHHGDHRGRRLPDRAPGRRHGRADPHGLLRPRLRGGDHLRPRQGREPAPRRSPSRTTPRRTWIGTPDSWTTWSSWWCGSTTGR